MRHRKRCLKTDSKHVRVLDFGVGRLVQSAVQSLENASDSDEKIEQVAA